MEENKKTEEKFKRSMETLQYIIETSVSSDIESVELTDFTYYPKYNSVESKLIIKTYCEDHDFRSLGDVMDKADTEIIKIIGQYNFKSNGSLKKRHDGQGYWISVMPVGSKWSTYGENKFDVFMEYLIYQDDFPE
jgi:hypothetical protein